MVIVLHIKDAHTKNPKESKTKPQTHHQEQMQVSFP